MIQLKGRQAGALKCIVPDDMSERQMFDGFSSLLSSGSNLLKGSRIIIDLQQRRFSPALVTKIWKNFIEPSGCSIAYWIVEDGDSRVALDRMGFKTSAEDTAPQGLPSKQQNHQADVVPAFVYFGTLRGGQNISHNGDVIVIGNVNQGAEVTAGGDVVIIGRLNGLVHAGCDGSDEMVIITRSLEAGQIRIGTKVGIIDRNSPFWGRDVSIKIANGEVQVLHWPAL